MREMGRGLSFAGGGGNTVCRLGQRGQEEEDEEASHRFCGEMRGWLGVRVHGPIFASGGRDIPAPARALILCVDPPLVDSSIEWRSAPHVRLYKSAFVLAR